MCARQLVCQIMCEVSIDIFLMMCENMEACCERPTRAQKDGWVVSRPFSCNMPSGHPAHMIVHVGCHMSPGSVT